VQNRIKPSFKSKWKFFNCIDRLPSGPKWSMKHVRVRGDKVDGAGKRREESLELWMRDPAEVAAELLGNPVFRGSICYAFQPAFMQDKNGTERAFTEMWTADWWRQVEVSPDFEQRWIED
jgi:hypothetical protein